MAKRKPIRAGIKYPKHLLCPDDVLDFIEIGNFTNRWNDLGLDDESDLSALQFMIMANPDGAPVIKGTGGLRKLRFAPVSWNSGKSGAARICYVYFREFGIVLLVTAYGKGEKESLSNEEKKIIKRLIAEAEHELKRRRTLK